jgi:hypothetical protein
LSDPRHSPTQPKEKARKSAPLGTDPALTIPTRQGAHLDLAYWDLWFALVATRDCGGELAVWQDAWARSGATSPSIGDRSSGSRAICETWDDA